MNRYWEWCIICQKTKKPIKLAKINSFNYACKKDCYDLAIR